MADDEAALDDSEAFKILLKGVELGRTDVVTRLARSRSALLSLRTEAGETALHVAARLGGVDACRSLLSLGASANARTPGGAAALSLAPAGDAAIRMAFVSAALTCVAGGDADALGDMLLGGVGADDPIADGADAPTLAGFAADMGAPEEVLGVLARGGAAPGDAAAAGAGATNGTPDAGVATPGGTALPRVAYLQLKLEEKDELIAALKSSIVELSTVAGELRAVATSAGTVKVVDHVRELRAKLAAAALEAAAKDEEMARLHRRVEAWRAKAESLAEFRRTATATAAAAAAPLQQAAAPDAEEPSRRRIPRRERVGVLMDTRRGAPVAETPSEVAARAARDAAAAPPAPAAAPDDASSKTRPKRLTRRERVAGLMGERRNTEPLPARPAPSAPSSLSPPPSPHVVSVDGMTGELVVSPPGKPRAIEPVSHWEIGNGAPTVPELHGLLHV